ncbi:hypothetical protein, partial [Rhodococcus erythropolis]|uniref:hypothetical protein n=1 Tax=Rhodococcus erythropolis TaxID=1833 RepID=UPI001C4066A1
PGLATVALGFKDQLKDNGWRPIFDSIPGLVQSHFPARPATVAPYDCDQHSEIAARFQVWIMSANRPSLPNAAR